MTAVQKTHFADDETLERLTRYEKALEYIAEEHDAGRHDGLPEPCPAHSDHQMWVAAIEALEPAQTRQKTEG